HWWGDFSGKSKPCFRALFHNKTERHWAWSSNRAPHRARTWRRTLDRKQRGQRSHAHDSSPLHRQARAHARGRGTKGGGLKHQAPTSKLQGNFNQPNFKAAARELFFLEA